MDRIKILLLGPIRISKVLISNKLNAIGISVIEFPGVGDGIDNKNIQRDIVKNRHYFVDIFPINAFVLVLNWNNYYECDLAIKQFLQLFGVQAIQTLLIIGIKENEENLFDLIKIREAFTQTNGYRMLFNKNNGNEIPCFFLNDLRLNKNDEKQILSTLKLLRSFDMQKFLTACNILESETDKKNETSNINIPGTSTTGKSHYDNQTGQAATFIIKNNENQRPSFHNSNICKKHVLVTGSPNSDQINYLLKSIFSVKESYKDSKKDYETDLYILSIECGLEKASFNIETYRNKCNRIKTNLAAIISIENLNPRPETLVNNMKILERTFSSDELSKLLYIFFTSDHSIKIDEIRDSFLQFNEILRILRLNNSTQRAFVNQKIHLLSKSNAEELKKIIYDSSSENKKINADTHMSDCNSNNEDPIFGFLNYNEFKTEKNYFTNDSHKIQTQYLEPILIDSRSQVVNNYQIYSDYESSTIKKKHVLITGSPNSDQINFLLKSIFSVKESYKDSKKDYETDLYILNIECGLEKACFNIETYRNKCNRIKTNLAAIISIENLNPRPETLVNNMKILERTFSSDELSKLLYIFFTSDHSIKIDEIRDSFLQFNEILRILRLNNSTQRAFVNQKIHLLSQSNAEELKKIRFVF